mgnify:CR=1 FL=1
MKIALCLSLIFGFAVLSAARVSAQEAAAPAATPAATPAALTVRVIVPALVLVKVTSRPSYSMMLFELRTVESTPPVVRFAAAEAISADAAMTV